VSDSKTFPLADQLPPQGTLLDADTLLERFLSYTDDRGFEMYPAQEEAILEIFAEHNVVLNTPTGSGKSLVALAACFKALADGKFAYYTAPIKALVTEKFFELCEILGPINVGMMTGDATVNRDAPILCCTAEILANLAVREGEETQADWVVMDEFHYYADRDRGVAWQIPLITLPRARFLLMSATLGNPDFFTQSLTRFTGSETALVRSEQRPVPLDFSYSEVPLQQAVEELVEENKSPIYIVHFSQRAASEQAQNLMSLNFTSKEDKRRIKEELRGFRFDSPFGKELARFIPHGIGVHHAGMLPKYRRLIERLARLGLLEIICGTDTLGVGVNVPIRTVLFTQLCKFDGRKMIVLSTRDFQQIAGRAGRRGFDTAGSVVVQAPEHEIENLQLRMKAEGNPKKLKKLRTKKPPERGYKAWNAETLERLQQSNPAPLQSRFSVSHGLLLNVLAGPGGWRRGVRILRGCHESPSRKRTLLHEGMQLFRSLLSAGIVEFSGGHLRINEDLQQDFSLHHALSLYALEVFAVLDSEASDYALSLLSVVESTLESPSVILRSQVSLLKTRLVNELKAEGVEYEARMDALEKVDYPKPEEELLESTFEMFREHHPWVAGHGVEPKSIVRDMLEQCASFNIYIKEYGLARSEGVLLRYMTDCYRALRQTVPEAFKTEELLEIEDWLGAELRRVDASLIKEWERLESGEIETEEEEEEEGAPDITRDRRAFRALVKTSVFRLVQALSARRYQRCIDALGSLAEEEDALPKDSEGALWSASRLEETLAAYWQEYEEILTDADARSSRRIRIDESAAGVWQLRQTLSDPEENHEWALLLRVDLEKSAAANRVVALLESVAGESDS
jgi:superfamily II RNA helicase